MVEASRRYDRDEGTMRGSVRLWNWVLATTREVGINVFCRKDAIVFFFLPLDQAYPMVSPAVLVGSV